ncbi:Receptor expression-enhancing protein 2 [Lamellibrachia satsuma]|nr:Receptor expression-enhancing protein 2 [Lamellibrachia satsuma]
MVSALISRVIILVFGTLYPAYASYKAVKTKNVKEYVKWMMYWIVFAFFTCIETFADIFVAWIPFYYELKIVFVLWLLSPATKGASIIYRKFIHQQLSKREKEIDSYIAKASDQGYSALLTIGSRGLNYATSIVVQTAIKGQSTIVDHLKKSYSMNDLSDKQPGTQKFAHTEGVEDIDDETDNRLIEESYQQEMAEKRMSEMSEMGEMGEMGEKAYEEEDGSREVTRPRTRRRPASYIEPDLNPLMEGDEKGDEVEELQGGKSGKPTSSGKSYVHTEKLRRSSMPSTTFRSPPAYLRRVADNQQRWSSPASMDEPSALATWRTRLSYTK